MSDLELIFNMLGEAATTALCIGRIAALGLRQMPRDLVRGADPAWVESLYSRAIAPDAVYFLKATPGQLALRTLKTRQRLDYWESGMNMSLSRDWFDCFDKYQRLINHVFESLQKQYKFDVINADRPINTIQRDLRSRIGALLKKEIGARTPRG